MSEPTIDEMLAWLDMAVGDDLPGAATAYYGNCETAIRAILEQHRHYSEANTDLVIIRAFVERVEHRIEERYGFGLKAECKTMREELAAMEREIQTQ